MTELPLGKFRMWQRGSESIVDVPVSGGENVMVPVIRAIVSPVGDPSLILLQRRDEPGETVRGMLEIPGGRWGAGESPIASITREVLEETGIELVSVSGVSISSADTASVATVSPLAVIAGVDGAFPAVHVVLTAEGDGEPRDAPGESADVGWWNLADAMEALVQSPEDFIPSSAAALRAYAASMGI